VLSGGAGAREKLRLLVFFAPKEKSKVLRDEIAEKIRKTYV